MKVRFSNQSSLLDDARDDIRDRIYFALSRFSPRIEQVTVHIADVVGTPGSSQMLCRLSVRIKELGSFSIESVEDEVAIAVSRAAERAAKQLQRILYRQRDETRWV